jgi:hypothetical protein
MISDETTADQPQWPPHAPGHYTTYERYVRVCQEVLIIAIFLGDRGPLLLSPWGLDPSLLNVRFVLSAIEYRRTVFQYFEWLLGHNRLAGVNRHASTAIHVCAKGSALKTPFRRKSYWSMHQISCSKEYCSQYDSNVYSFAADLTFCHPLKGILSYFLKHAYMLKEGGLPSGL